MLKKKMVGGSAWVSLRAYNQASRRAEKAERRAAALYEDALAESATAQARRDERDEAIRLRNEAQVKLVEVERDLADAKERAAKAESLANESASNKRLYEMHSGEAKTLRKALRETREALLQKHVLLQTITRIADRRAGIGGTIAGTQRDLLQRRILDGLRSVDTDVARAIMSAWDPEEGAFTFEGAIMAIGADDAALDVWVKANELLKLSDELREMDRKETKDEQVAVASVVALVNEALAVDMPARNVSDDDNSKWSAVTMFGMGALALAAGAFVSTWITSSYKAKAKAKK